MNRRRFICIKCNYCYPCNQTFNIPPISQNLCINCHQGPQGVPGPSGATGPIDPQGLPGNALAFADFYALMPNDNAASITPGSDVSFPQDGPNSGDSISRLGPSSFRLGEIGTYQVFFQVSIGEAGQLILNLNGEDLYYTLSGRATGTDQIVGMSQ